jgi:translation initiation factor 2 subunit 2
MEEYEELLDSLYKKLPKKSRASERFEPPRFSSFMQGNQTMIRNFLEVATALRREPQHLLKFISKELATAGNYDAGRAMLQGKFKEEQLNSRLSAYIKEYVMCNECKKPDTTLTTFEGAKYKRCEVCGARAPVKAI